MSFAELKSELDRLSPEQRREVRTYLAAIDKLEDPAFRQRMADKLNDPNPDRWISYEDAKKRLGL